MLKIRYLGTTFFAVYTFLQEHCYIFGKFLGEKDLRKYYASSVEMGRIKHSAINSMRPLTCNASHRFEKIS